MLCIMLTKSSYFTCRSFYRPKNKQSIKYYKYYSTTTTTTTTTTTVIIVVTINISFAGFEFLIVMIVCMTTVIQYRESEMVSSNGECEENAVRGLSIMVFDKRRRYVTKVQVRDTTYIQVII
ncbi:hypothetical protein T01_1885 [Trichinella spiralis]|uniref:Transmembrane protein n=1 Tax=Trichinella spiralis TaxID=6334 RepID=A0A0V1B8H8_TRISP|nr:hypothetical protein T01_1885 [Trichinella spiralis]